MEKQHLDAESSTGDISLPPKTPAAEPAASRTTVILPPQPVEEPPSLPLTIAEPAVEQEAVPADRVEPAHDTAVQDKIHIPEISISPAPLPDQPVLPTPASVIEEEKTVIAEAPEDVTEPAAPIATAAVEPEEKPIVSEPAAPVVEQTAAPAPAAGAESGHNSIEQIEQRLAFAREMGDRHNEATALADLGGAQLTARAYRKSIAAFEQALAIHRELHNRQGEADALGNLGLAHEAHGDLFEPIELFEQALLIYRDIGDRRGEAGALWISSLSFNKLGNRSAAVSNAEAALRIFEELADPTAATVRTQLDDWRATT